MLARGHKLTEVRRAVDNVKFSQIKEILQRVRDEPFCVALETKERKEEFQRKYKGCVFSVRHVPGMRKFEKYITPDLLDLHLSCRLGNIFPRKAFAAQTSPASLGARVKCLAAKAAADRRRKEFPESTVSFGIGPGSPDPLFEAIHEARMRDNHILSDFNSEMPDTVMEAIHERLMHEEE